MNRNEVEETVRLMRQIAAHRERAERYELAWTSARRRALGRREVIRRLRGQLADVYAVSAKERQQLDEARAEVVRLGKENDELRRTIRNLSEAYHASTVAAATDRLRAALDEERIEPEPVDLEGFDSGAYTTPAEGHAEPEHPRCAAISSTGFRCLLLRGPHAVHEASNRSGGSVSWPAGRTEGEAG